MEMPCDGQSASNPASKDDSIDDLAEEMDDDMNDGGTMELCRGSEIDIPILLTVGLYGRSWLAFEWLIVFELALC
ncbi:hypothetical protein CY34DRAFT_810289 [Suillus luteus UH-Slu-Lm8-n1]|uniref:Uncharacterized protein n=1 Tax=Suillus luteus UH-Slu-Lm8-n1 TaxID=930992 RepID=A0A0D0ATB6_9AGAM|nr:hypothetical protein CY34DRAFT_810289 [Suillus luteus UH-Slu-Lm8-n1]